MSLGCTGVVVNRADSPLTATCCLCREVVTQQYAKAASQDVTLSASGSDALIHMDAWAMAASVTGGPEL